MATNVPQVVAMPHVVLVHGFLDNARGWDALGSQLTKAGYSCTSVDLRGAGQLRHSDGPYTLFQATADVLGVVYKIAGDVVLIGHSMGAQIAELAASELPKKVTGLVLITPTPLGGNKLPDTVRAVLREAGDNVHAQQEIRRSFARNMTAEQIRDLTDPKVIMGKAAVQGYYDAFTSGHPRGTKPSAYEHPTLIIGAEEDPVIAPDMVRQIRETRFPAAHLSMILKSGHWPHLEQAESCAAEIFRFLTRLGYTN